jgi:diadenosine tetraphosphate (Ap4A) HIT family hydrolase
VTNPFITAATTNTNAMCVLCCEIGGELVWQDQHCRVVLPAEADYPGFVRVIAKQHVGEMTDLTLAVRDHIMAVVWTCESVLREIMEPTKVNLAALGNVVPHVHWHIIARFSDDRHFPNPIWGEPKRQTSSTDHIRRQTRSVSLPASLALALTQAFAVQ